MFVLSAMLLIACSDPPSPDLPVSTKRIRSAEEIIQQSVEYHGGIAYDTAEIQFSFRGKQYAGSWNHGMYRFSRSFSENRHHITDLLTNETFTRLINGQVTAVPDSMERKYSASVNSVWYFAYLPFRLLDPAVQARTLGQSNMHGASYHKVEVTFSEKGGGEDFEDVYVYWFDQSDYSLDYLAYSFAEDDGIGLRFRKACDSQRVSGILFQDYVNYRADPTEWEVADLDSAYRIGALDTLSVILMEDIRSF